MIMTDSEICVEYRDAKDKRKQIEILADENVCSKDDIKYILLTHGYSVIGNRSRELIQKLKDNNYDKDGNKLPEVTQCDDTMPDEYDGVGEINTADFQRGGVSEGLPTEALEVSVSDDDLSDEEQPAVEYHKIEDWIPLSERPTMETITVPSRIAGRMRELVAMELEKIEALISDHKKLITALELEYTQLSECLR